MKLICPDCGTQYESGKFCQECGARLQEVTPELVCPSCGYKAKTGKFCPECGTKLTEQCSMPAAGAGNVCKKSAFNEKDERFAKYYDKKGFPRQVSPEERNVAIAELSSYAEQGVAEAKMLLGNILVNNQDRENNIQGIKYIKEAEESGNKFAYYLMGVCCVFGIEGFVDQNPDEAEKRLLECYQEFEDGEIAGFLADLYMLIDDKRDYQKAFEYATIAASEDGEEGYAVLGALYLNGWGVEKSIELSLENYKQAAALGNETAMNQIGYIYMGNDGFMMDQEKAFYWFNEAAKRGSDVGMFNLAFCYETGFGVKEDREIAAEWYKKAAELGYVPSMLSLGEYYQDVLIDSDKSKNWYQRAAESGNPEGMNRLGVIYDNEQNYQEAIKWYEAAIEQNQPNAYRNLALCFLNGNGVEQDLRKAEELLAKAVELGVDDAEGILLDMKTSAEDNRVNDATVLSEKTTEEDNRKVQEESECKAEDLTVECEKGTQNGHDYVDLGLSVKWATMNVGATKPEEYGDYFAWGETKKTSIKPWYDKYKYCNGSYNKINKYCTDRSYGYRFFKDNKTVLDLEDDAAHVNWGGSWRMPTRKEQDELRENCTWTWTTLNGVNGCKVQSKISGYTDNWIFLPAAGYRDEMPPMPFGRCYPGSYWSSSLYAGCPAEAYYLGFDSDSVGWPSDSRYRGLSVRPVCP